MAAKKPKPEMTVAEAGRLGGQKILAERGVAYYAEIGKKGGRTTRQRGPEWYAAIGRRGGQTTKDTHGPEFYEKIGAKGGQRLKELIELAKRTEKEKGA